MQMIKKKATAKRLIWWVLAAALLLAGCNPAAQVRDWAKTAESGTWHARYRLFFHQKDGDLQMLVQESKGETLVLEIQAPRGSLRLEYGPEKFSLDLDRGNLQWQELPQQIPYYSLIELARQLVEASTLAVQGEWVEYMGYRLKARGGAPVEVGYLSEWTLQVEEFIWD